MLKTINLVRNKQMLHGERLPYDQRHTMTILLTLKILNDIYILLCVLKPLHAYLHVESVANNHFYNTNFSSFF